VFVFNGGPGQAATDGAGWASTLFSQVRSRRDVVLVDRRGTGGSNPLRCPEPDGSDPARLLEPTTPAKIRQCRDLLAAKADLELYTTPIAMDDVDAVRASLGYDRINLFGPSYGSREALVYLRRFPRRVRAVILQATIPPHRRSVFSAAASAQLAIDRLIDDCMSDDRCRTAFPALRLELEEVLARLEHSPASFDSSAGQNRPAQKLTLTRDDVAGTIRSLMVGSAGASLLPSLIHAAHGGDFAPIGELMQRLRGGFAVAFSRGLFLSVICAEEVAGLDEEEVSRASSGSFWGDAWASSLIEQCRQWPTGKLPDNFFEPVRAGTPVLVLHGWLDPITPPSWAIELTRHLPNARAVIVRHGHHALPDEGCIASLVAEFIDGLDVHGLDTSCVAGIERPAFAVD
jgi:pimeloyl-ACP methyl ester carboxylesterase